jgi:hypothetical protein
MTFVCLLYPSLKNFYSLFQTNILLAVALTAKRISPYTLATATCKEKLLIPLHNSLLIIFLDLWEQNISVFNEEWVGHLIDFLTIGVVGKILVFPILIFHCQLHRYVFLEIRPIHECEFMILDYVFLTRKWLSFINDFTKHD